MQANVHGHVGTPFVVHTELTEGLLSLSLSFLLPPLSGSLSPLELTRVLSSCDSDIEETTEGALAQPNDRTQH